MGRYASVPWRQRGRWSSLGLRNLLRGKGAHEHFRCGRLVAERFVRPDRVVATPPTLDDDPRLAHSVADFTIEQFIADALTRLDFFGPLARKRSLRLDQEIGRGPEIRQAMSSIMNDSGRPAIQSQLLIPP